jgi:hypothetical protein
MAGRRESPREPPDRLLGELVQGADVLPGRGGAAVEADQGALEAGLCGGMEPRGTLARSLEQAPSLGPRRFDQGLRFELRSLDRAGGLPLGREYPVDRLRDLGIG